MQGSKSTCSTAVHLRAHSRIRAKMEARCWWYSSISSFARSSERNGTRTQFAGTVGTAWTTLVGATPAAASSSSTTRRRRRTTRSSRSGRRATRTRRTASSRRRTSRSPTRATRTCSCRRSCSSTRSCASTRLRTCHAQQVEEPLGQPHLGLGFGAINHARVSDGAAAHVAPTAR